MFRLNRNERSHWSGNGVHVESELVFMIGRNMQLNMALDGYTPRGARRIRKKSYAKVFRATVAA